MSKNSRVENFEKCFECGEPMKHRDFVKRIQKLGYEEKIWISVERFYCPRCRKYRRKLPESAVRYKQYAKYVIDDVLEDSEDAAYEDYPCDMTKKRWKSSQEKHG